MERGSIELDARQCRIIRDRRQHGLSAASRDVHRHEKRHHRSDSDQADEEETTHTTDLRAMVNESVGMWNTKLGFTALVETADSNAAQIIVSLENLGRGTFGKTKLTPRYAFWQEPPERARPALNTYYEHPFYAANEVALTATLNHEICHAMGHRGHIMVFLQNAKGNRIDDILMYFGGIKHKSSPGQFDLRVMRALKMIPSGTHFQQYEEFFDQGNFPPLGAPDPPLRRRATCVSLDP
jgi:hypothetical protein